MKSNTEAATSNGFQDLREQEREVRRRRIMDAAEQVFAEKTFDRVNMREIAAAAGVSPATIYTYFPDQEALFIETALRGAERLRDRFDVVSRAGNPSPAETARLYIDYIMDHYECLRMSQHCLLYGRFQSPESLERIGETYRGLFERIDRVLAGDSDDPEVRHYTHLFFAALNGILFTFGRYPGRDREEALAHMRRLGKLLGELMEGRGKGGQGSQ
jgi:AcrR family transcriptional regulator